MPPINIAMLLERFGPKLAATLERIASRPSARIAGEEIAGGLGFMNSMERGGVKAADLFADAAEGIPRRGPAVDSIASYLQSEGHGYNEAARLQGALSRQRPLSPALRRDLAQSRMIDDISMPVSVETGARDLEDGAWYSRSEGTGVYEARQRMQRANQLNALRQGRSVWKQQELPLEGEGIYPTAGLSEHGLQELPYEGLETARSEGPPWPKREQLPYEMIEDPGQIAARPVTPRGRRTGLTLEELSKSISDRQATQDMWYDYGDLSVKEDYPWMDNR